MPRKKVDILNLSAIEIDRPRFSFGAVTKILNLPVWKLRKYLESPRFPLSASGQLGEGKGSRRWFTTEDVYRIGLADFLLKDGFSPKLVSRILREIYNEDWLSFDENGEVRIAITLTRAQNGPKIDFFRSGSPPDVEPESGVYYLLDLEKVTSEIDRRIDTATSKKVGRPQ